MFCQSIAFIGKVESLLLQGRFYGSNANITMRIAKDLYFKAVQQAYWLGLSCIYIARPRAEWLQPLTSFVGIKLHAPNLGAHAHMTKHAGFLAGLQAFRNFFKFTVYSMSH